MKIIELYENDEEHNQALRQTGFWGNQAAGCILFAQDTKRFLLMRRSDEVLEPHTWGSVGGAIDAQEHPKHAVTRELEEETGYDGRINLLPLLLFKKETFRYQNFLAIIPEEFTPRLNWEADGYQWCEFGEWPSPLHFGIKTLFKDAASMKVIRQALTD
jgi:8-oxo-dGTP pyrophosphatase MutT (NUDIX family)